MQKIVIQGQGPRVGRRRAAELFTDGRFRAQTVRNRKIYTRKGRSSFNPKEV